MQNKLFNAYFINCKDTNWMEGNKNVKTLDSSLIVKSFSKLKNEMPYPLLSKTMERVYQCVFPSTLASFLTIELENISDEALAAIEMANEEFDEVIFKYDTRVWGYAIFGNKKEQKNHQYLVGLAHPLVTNNKTAYEYAQKQLSKTFDAVIKNLEDNKESYVDAYLLLGQNPNLTLNNYYFNPNKPNLI